MKWQLSKGKRYAWATRSSRDLRWEIRTSEAEWNVPEGRVGGLVLQLRQRGHTASSWAQTILIALLVTIVIGIGYYVIRPLLQDLSDGRKGIYQQQLREAKSENSTLDIGRRNLQNSLAQALKPAGVVLDVKILENIQDIVNIPESQIVVAASSEGKIWRSSNQGNDWKEAYSGDESAISNLVVLADNRTVFASNTNGEILKSYDTGKTWEIIQTNSPDTSYKIIKLKNSTKLFATSIENSIQFSDDGGSSWSRSTFSPSIAEAINKLRPLRLRTVRRIISRAPIKIFESDDKEYLVATKSRFAAYSSKDGGKSWMIIKFDDGYNFIDELDGFTTERSKTRNFSLSLLFRRFHRIKVIEKNGTFIALKKGVLYSLDKKTNTFISINKFHGLKKPLIFQHAKIGALFLFGDKGEIFRSSVTSKRWQAVKSNINTQIVQLFVVPESKSIIGSARSGELIRSVDQGKSWNLVYSKLGETSLVIYAIDNGKTLIGLEGSSLPIRSTDDGKHWAEIDIRLSPERRYELFENKSANLVFLSTSDGIKYHSDDNGEFWSTIATGGSDYVRKFLPIPASDISLALDGNGQIIRISNDEFQRINSANHKSGSKGDSSLSFNFENLPENLRDHSKLSFFSGELAALLRNRTNTQAKLTDASGKLEKLKDGTFSIDQKQIAFDNFMKSCRQDRNIINIKPVDGNTGQLANALQSDDKTTQVCISAFKDFLPNENKTWWVTIAEEVPRGILLLFLLATLATLYRYNLRLAAFHHSRADALEMYSEGKSIADLEKIVNSFAAEKVAFGKANTPADQAAGVLKAAIDKVGPG